MILALVILLQAAIGFGIVRHVSSLRPIQALSLSLLVGLPLSSVLMVAIDLLGLGLTALSMVSTFTLAAVLLNLGWGRKTSAALSGPWPRASTLRPDEAVFIVLIAGFALISLWQCVRLPVVARDAAVGADLVAKYAILEGRINSSLFTGEALRGQLSNQPYYAPFVMLMQIVYRLAGMPFGQVWQSVLFFSFLIYLYSRMRERIHPLLAGFLLLSLTTVPLMYSYTYLVNPDFSSAVFFGLGAMLLHDFRQTRRPALLGLSGLLMGLACWSRSETILFVVAGTSLVTAASARRTWRLSLGAGCRFLLAPIVLFVLWHVLYLQIVFPDAPRMAALASGTGGKELLDTLGGVARLLGAGDLYGTIIYLFGAVLVINLVVFRDRGGGSLLAWIAILLIGFVAIVQIFPAAFVESTVKRGFLRLFPIMIAYAAESRLFAFFTGKLRNFRVMCGVM